MVKAEKARAVEDLLIRLAQSNQLRNKVSEQQLIDLLGQINQQEPSASQTRIVVRTNDTYLFPIINSPSSFFALAPYICIV